MTAATSVVMTCGGQPFVVARIRLVRMSLGEPVHVAHAA